MNLQPVRFAESGPPPSLFERRRTGLVLRGALPQDAVDRWVDAIGASAGDPAWDEPNSGMPGGHLRVVGEAATPTFRTPRGPSIETYQAAAALHAERTAAVLGEDAWPALQAALGGGVRRPVGPSGVTWPGFSVRSLGPGQQIYAHHDDHYALEVFGDLDPGVSRDALLSWFVTLQPAEAGGELVVYGVDGDDPGIPVLPTRFLDAEALDREGGPHRVALGAGDLVVFDSGRHVHRVTEVEGPRPRLTIGGFLGAYADGSGVACWS